jgi:hypothetical protein
LIIIRLRVVLTIRVFHGDNLLVVVKVVEQRGEHLPASIELIVTDKVGVVTLQGIQDQGLVGLRDLEVGEAATVGEIQLSDNSLHGESGKLRVHLDVNRLVGLNSDNKLVARNVLEDSRGNIAELNTDFGLLLVQGWY